MKNKRQEKVKKCFMPGNYTKDKSGNFVYSAPDPKDPVTKMLKKHQDKLKTTRKIAEKMVFG